MERIVKRLFQLQDPGYREFSRKLTPGAENVIGVRIPQIRALAKELGRDAEFLAELPHEYFEEYNLHAIMVSSCRDYGEAVRLTDALLPYVDNWATCDILSPKAFAKNRGLLAADIDRWLVSGETFTVRFALEMMMTHFLDADFDPAWLEKAAAVECSEYYVSMMVAWYFATALAKQWDAALPYLERHRLDGATHRRTIQKAVESFRIPDGRKEYLKTLRDGR